MIYRTLLVCGIILALTSLYFGVLSPFIRAREYIAAVRSISSVRTIQEFEDNFNRSLLFPSPIGKEEVVKFLGNDIANILFQEGQSKEIAQELVRFIEPHLFRNNVRHMLLGGQLYAVLWERYGRSEENFVKAEFYYRQALSIGPNLPPPLFALLGLYIAHGDTEQVGEMRTIILSYWPDAFLGEGQ